ncbi:unnamed protein product [Nezara viridula]|uniref:C2H2-type domain-containing protein n=1 Tax=Nezara viridula TaxID=85310 RepID=A0A9P0MYI3_NEZVI|nr:unnamed protein product [Nezara viridula]
MSKTNEDGSNRIVYDLSEDPGDAYFCTPCKMEFRREEDLLVHLKLRDHKRKKKYDEKIYNRRVFGESNEQGPLLMSEPETSEEEDETTKYEREARLRNNLCVHKGYGFSCGECVEKRIDMEENGNFDFVKIGKHLETVYKRMVDEYGDDLSLPSSCSDDLEENIFEKSDALVESLSKYDGVGMDKKDEEAEDEKKKKKKTEEAKNVDSMEEVRSRFEEVLLDPDSGYDNQLPRVVSFDGEEFKNSDSENEDEELNNLDFEKEEKEFDDIFNNPFKNSEGEVPSKYEMMRGKIRFSNLIKKIPL